MRMATRPRRGVVRAIRSPGARRLRLGLLFVSPWIIGYCAVLPLPVPGDHLLQLHQLHRDREPGLHRARQLLRPAARQHVPHRRLQHLLLHGHRGAVLDRGGARAGAAAQHERARPGHLPDPVLHPLDRPRGGLVADLRLDLPAVVRHRERPAVRRARQRARLVLLDHLVQADVHPARPVGARPADGDLPGGAAGGAQGTVRGGRPGRRGPVAAAPPRDASRRSARSSCST